MTKALALLLLLAQFTIPTRTGRTAATGGGGLAVNSQMPTQTGQYNATQTSPWTWAFTNTAGNVLYLAVMTAENPSTVTVTYNSVSMTLLGTSGAVTGTSSSLKLFRLSSPATGSNNFVVTMTPSSTQTVAAAAISFSGANATPDTGTATTNNDASDFSHTAFPLTLTSTTSGNIGIEAACFGDPSYSSVSDTLSANTSAHPDGGGSCNNFALQYGTIGGTSKTLTINGTTATSWATIGIEVKH